MKKIIVLFLSIPILILSGCGQSKNSDSASGLQDTTSVDDSPSDQQDTQVTSNEKNEGNSSEEGTSSEGETSSKVSYKIETQKYEDGSINIEYPQITGLDNDIQTKWNELLKKKATIIIEIFKQELPSETNYVVQTKFDVKTQNENLISILVSTYINFENAAHPSTRIETYNINLSTGENIRLKSTDKISTYAENIFNNNNIKFKNESNKDKFNEYIKNRYESAADLEGDLETFDIDVSKDFSYPPEGYSYYDNGKLVICLPTIHALGKFIEIEME